MTTPRELLDRQLRRLDRLVDDGEIDPAVSRRLEHFADALDDRTTRRKYHDGRGNLKTLEPGTIASYVKNLRISVEKGFPLLDTDAAAFNAFIDGRHDDDGLTKGTLCGYQSAARAFYRYHDDLGVDPEAITTYKPDKTPRHDEQDMFTEAEVDRLRQACDNPRDRALLELLIYTGQRITALRTLRIKDIDCQAGVLYLNDEADGLKGARTRGRKRPLFGARKYVRDWLEYHPRGDDPDAPVFVGNPSHHLVDLDKPINGSTIRQNLSNLASRAGVRKPVNPHNFRHYFVTVMKREYGMDSDTLKALLGVAADSVVLETVYSHVTNDDYVRRAETTLGYRQDDSGPGSLTPDACPTCGEILEDHWRRCPSCDEVFGPTEQAVSEAVDGAQDAAVDEFADIAQELSPEEIRAFSSMLEAFSDPVAVVDRLEGD